MRPEDHGRADKPARDAFRARHPGQGSLLPEPTEGLASLRDIGIADRVPIAPRQLEAFCRKHKIREFALFGSVLRDDFGPDSDVDVLVEFEPDACFSLLDFVRMQNELGRLFGREVDLVEKVAVTNPFVRHRIRHNHRIVFNAA
ncbi:MAG: nucleotidyltransferase family protein [Gemmatimonadetes bacterium]|nr:nucleotidyltransferase family protein [Gemmatimonadota bacterium]